MRTSSSEIFYRICALVGLLLPLAILLACSESFLRKHEGDEPQSYRARYAELFDHQVDAPIVILGSSNSAHGLIPSSLKLPKPVFNFSFNGATCSFNLSFYRKYLKPNYRKPEYVIYALSPNSFSYFWRKIEDDVKYTPASTQNLAQALRNPNELKIYNSGTITQDIVRVHARENAGGIHRGLDMRKFENGYLPYDIGKPFELIANKSINAETSEIFSLETLLGELKQDGIQVILVTLPAPDKQYKQADLESFDHTVDKLGKAISAPVIKADIITPGFGKDYTLFNDDVHLTDRGAHLFSAQLGTALRKLIH